MVSDDAPSGSDPFKSKSSDSHNIRQYCASNASSYENGEKNEKGHMQRRQVRVANPELDI